MVVADSVIRLLNGVILEDSINDESYENGLLEYPQYTKPQDYNGEKIPDVLASGNHENIRKWRRQQSLVMTREKRKDLFDAYVLTEEDKKLLKEYDNKNE